MKIYLLVLLLLSNYLDGYSQKDSIFIPKEYTTSFATSSPKIDGDLEDDAWKDVPSINDLKQGWPIFDTVASQQTEVKIIYDNTAIYIFAKMFDECTDSICKQLGNRDDNLNAGQFRILFDTYNKQQDAFGFNVSASGVQGDYRFLDGNYNAVWESAVKIVEDGWYAEIKIPYSALRFPNVEEQVWGMQITRNVVRNGEFSQWALTPRGVQNFQKYWGLLKGIKNIKAPVRLSFTPYVTSYLSHYPVNIEGESNYTANIVGGMDLKYGINESFTLDASLLPDFSQTQSDNLVKNLSAFEVQYNEQRAFFQENTDLFGKGNIFYSRRIGRQPSEYYNVYEMVKEGEEIVQNPNAAKLLNIAKISGRTETGLGIGVMNAVLDNTYAIARDSLGNERKILTEPFSNYNITVFDQQLKNSSSLYLINANVNRKHGYNNANITGFGGELNNKKNTYQLAGDVAMTNVLTPDSIPNQYKDKFGFGYFAAFSKTSGKLTFELNRVVINDTYDQNDIGITNQTNYMANSLWIGYNQYEPFGKFLNANVGINARILKQYTLKTFNGLSLGFNSFAMLKSFRSFYFGGNGNPYGEKDYFEPRTDGRYFHRTQNMSVYGGFNSDSRKKMNFSINVWGGSTGIVSESIGKNPFFGFGFGPQFRANDKLTVRLNGNYSDDNKDRGYVNTDTNGDIIFGVRYRTNVSYSLNVKYIFKNNLALSINGRHYWDRADYVSFHNLSEDGLLLDQTTYNGNHDFSYNAVNIDLLFQWQFAPGSFLTLAWKNNISHEDNFIVKKYSENFKSTISADQLNTISLKVLYYFDYLYLRKKENL